MANNLRTVGNLLGEEIRRVNDYRREANLPKQGRIEYRISPAELNKTAQDFNDDNGTFSQVAKSRTNDYIFVEEDFYIAAANDGNSFDVQGLDKDHSGRGAMRHRGFRSYMY